VSPGKRVSATDMLSRGRRSTPTPESTTRPVDESTSPIVDQSPAASPIAVQESTPAATSVQDPAHQTYAKVAVSLTPEQRRWLKTTPAMLGVEGLSSSDLVRLALTRLRADIEDGLPLTDLLIEQAHTEAQQLTGRRNRGLPTR
jgi:hypothetical protein